MLAWEAEVNLSEGLDRTITWFRGILDPSPVAWYGILVTAVGSWKPRNVILLS